MPLNVSGRVREQDGAETTLSGRFVCLTQEDIDLYVRKMRILKPLLRRRQPVDMLLQGGADAVSAMSLPI